MTKERRDAILDVDRRIKPPPMRPAAWRLKVTATKIDKSGIFR
jgi:hypothetical protein